MQLNRHGNPLSQADVLALMGDGQFSALLEQVGYYVLSYIHDQ